MDITYQKYRKKQIRLCSLEYNLFYTLKPPIFWVSFLLIILRDMKSRLNRMGIEYQKQRQGVKLNSDINTFFCHNPVVLRINQSGIPWLLVFFLSKWINGIYGCIVSGGRSKATLNRLLANASRPVGRASPAELSKWMLQLAQESPWHDWVTAGQSRVDAQTLAASNLWVR